ncbi:hypothetical protein BSKO_02944 [Bryopsis sp. KO-2023]|nr:hypothetical protein BSKO_02944 [Bryopsis sp. KO-2023]
MMPHCHLPSHTTRPTALFGVRRQCGKNFSSKCPASIPFRIDERRFRSLRLRSSASVPVLALSAVGTKLISSSEIPAFIPRSDLMSEMLRWATIDAGANGYDKFGMQMKVVPYHKDEEKAFLWGFDVLLLEDGKEATRLGIRLDDETVVKHEFVGYGEGGFPINEGRETVVEGKTFQIWKMDEEKIDEDTRETIREFCGALAEAVSGYYSFGSCFSEDSL